MSEQPTLPTLLEPEQLKERDRIAGLTRDELIEELCSEDAQVADGDFNTFFAMYRDGQPACIWFSTYSLRNELYEYTGIPEPERVFPEGEKEPEGMTLGKLLIDLMKLSHDPKIKDPSQWRVMMRFDLDGDVVLGAMPAEIKLDGFYQHVNVIGPRRSRNRGKRRE